MTVESRVKTKLVQGVLQAVKYNLIRVPLGDGGVSIILFIKMQVIMQNKIILII